MLFKGYFYEGERSLFESSFPVGFKMSRGYSSACFMFYETPSWKGWLAHLTSISCDHFSWPGIGTYFLPCLFTIDKTFVSLCLLDRFVYTFFSQLGLFTFISKRLGTMINA